MNYEARRAIFSQNVKSLSILTSYSSVQLSHDTSAPFLQEANFLYLTGIKEPGWKLVIANDDSYLIRPDIDQTHQVFDGSLSDECALEISGVDKILSRAEGEALVKQLAQTNNTVATLGDDPHAEQYDFVLNPAPQALKKYLEAEFNEVVDCRKDLLKMRAVKDENELREIRAAIELTLDSFEDVHKKTFTHEYEIEAEFNKAFRATGAEGHAYQPIVAGGKNACTLHYIKNNDPLPENGLVLLDIGARVNGYAADITRTYALGVPSDREKAVHAAVAGAHRAIIQLIQPGMPLKEYSEKVDEIMKQALENLGLMKSADDYQTYFPHAISHALGIDVHDTFGGYKTFMPGMVLTVEPGIYIPEEGIGVRIEDNILVTESGHENLSERLSIDL